MADFIRPEAMKAKALFAEGDAFFHWVVADYWVSDPIPLGAAHTGQDGWIDVHPIDKE